jgi:hypothetical protein
VVTKLAFGSIRAVVGAAVLVVMVVQAMPLPLLVAL